MNNKASRTAERVPGPGDIALAVGLVGVAILSGIFIDPSRPDTVAPTQWWQWALIITPPCLLAFRRVDPILITVAATIAQSAIWIADLPEVLLPMLVILYGASSDAGSRGVKVAVAASAVLTTVTAFGVRIADDVTLYQLPLVALTCGTAIGLGIAAQRQRRTAERLAAEVTETRMRTEQLRVEAVAQERASIARELHDSVGHALSVIAVQAEAASRTETTNPTATRQAITTIAATAREALSETRQVLAGLRRSAEPELAPAPNLEATRKLVDDLAATGFNVTLTETDHSRCEPPTVVSAGVYRIVQESLTNAINYGARTAPIEVSLTCTDQSVEIEVTNIRATGGDQTGRTTPGTGLAGMAERAEVLGGSFRAGPDGERFVVVATLPFVSTGNREQS